MKACSKHFLLAVAVFAFSLCVVQSTNLTLAVFISAIDTIATFSGGNQSGRPLLEAVDLAVELINNDSSILPGYTIDYKLTDSQVCMVLDSTNECHVWKSRINFCSLAV